MDSSALFKIGYGLYVLTAAENGRDNGCIVNSIMQVTSQTPIMGVLSVNRQNYTNGMIERTGKFNISILTEDVPFELIRRFGFQSGANTDKFSGFEDITRSENGLYYLTKHSNAYLSCVVKDVIDFDTHSVYKAELVSGKQLSDSISITYDFYHRNVKPKPAEAVQNSYRCKICNYVYNGATLPEDFICPLCKHGASDFEKI